MTGTGTHVAGSPASLGVDADDAVADDAVDGVALGVGHDGGSHEVQELNNREQRDFTHLWQRKIIGIGIPHL